MTRPAPPPDVAPGLPIDWCLAQIEARFGPGVARRLAVPRPERSRPAIPSGSLALDLATGIGGLPRGGVTELVGPESSGKTAMLHAALAAVQREGGIAALVDAEGSADAEALLSCGVDLADLIIAQPGSAPDALLLLTILARCGGVDALGLSSIAALRDLPPGGVDGDERGDLRAHDIARLLARWLRVLTAGLRDSPTAVIATNHLLRPLAAGRSPGGWALRHHALLRVVVEPLALLPDPAGGTRGLRVGLTVAKNKVGAPGGRAEADLIVGEGLDWAGELLRLGTTRGLVARRAQGLFFDDLPLGAGAGAARRHLRDDATLAARLRRALTDPPEAA